MLGRLTLHLQELGQRSAPIGHVHVGVVQHYNIWLDSRIGRSKLIEQQQPTEQPLHYSDVAVFRAVILHPSICAKCAANLWSNQHDSGATVLFAATVSTITATAQRAQECSRLRKESESFWCVHYKRRTVSPHCAPVNGAFYPRCTHDVNDWQPPSLVPHVQPGECPAHGTWSDHYAK